MTNFSTAYSNREKKNNSVRCSKFSLYGGSRFHFIFEQGLERSLQPQAPQYRPRTISGPPYQAPPHSKPSHIKPPISGPLPYQAPHIRPPFPYETPHPRPTILSPDDQYEAPR